MMEINPQYKDKPSITKFIEQLPQRFEEEGNIIYSARNIIKCFKLDDRRLIIVKKFHSLRLPQRIIYSFFRKSKAKRAFRNATELRQRAVSTPCNIAYLEQWENGLYKYGYYVTERDDSSPISERLNEPEKFDEILANAFASFTATLHLKGILHHDLNSTNVLYRKSGSSYTFTLIDINRMSFTPAGQSPSRKQCIQNLTRFTGRMDVYEYVIRQYAQCRGWEVEPFACEAIAAKVKHDKQWRRRKAFFKHFKRK